MRIEKVRYYPDTGFTALVNGRQAAIDGKYTLLKLGFVSLIGDGWDFMRVRIPAVPEEGMSAQDQDCCTDDPVLVAMGRWHYLNSNELSPSTRYPVTPELAQQVKIDFFDKAVRAELEDLKASGGKPKRIAYLERIIKENTRNVDRK